MNETFFQLWLGFMFLLGGVFAGLVLGVVAATSVARKWVTDHMPKAPEFFVIDELNLISVTTDDGDIVRQRMTMTTKAQEFNARMAEIWLEERNLVAMPKGVDFRPRAPIAGGDNAGR